MNNREPPILGLYILYTVILIAAVMFFTSRRSLPVQITAPTIAEVPGTTAVVIPSGEEASVIAEESSMEAVSASAADSNDAKTTLAANERITTLPEKPLPSVPATDSNDAKTTPAAKEWIAPLPEKPLPSVPFVNKCRINLHIRMQPSLSAKIIGRIPTRASGIIIELVDEQWAKIIYQDITGYSAYRYLDFDPAFLTAVPAQEEAPAAADEEIATQVSEQDVIVIRSSCYIRSSAGDKNKRNIIMTAQSNDTFPHMAAYDQPSWYAIAVEGQSIAYVSTKYAAEQTITAD